MLINKYEYLVLKFIQSHDTTDPITYIEVVNHPFDGDVHIMKTDSALEHLSAIGYIKPFGYRTGDNDIVSVTPDGVSAINEYEYELRKLESSTQNINKIEKTQSTNPTYEKTPFYKSDKFYKWIMALIGIATLAWTIYANLNGL